MRARVVSRLAGLALAAAALAGCGEEERAEPGVGDARPDTYVPDPGRRPPPPAEEDVCDPHPSARDAGAVKPSARDPRTLVLRLRDLPDGARFAPNSGGVQRFTFEGHEGPSGLEAAGFVAVAAGEFQIGRREPEPQPGAPEPPPSCLPATGIDAAAMTFRTAEGAGRVPLHRLAGMAVASGIGPVGARQTVSESPVDLGDEAALIVAPTDSHGTVNRTIAWRDGPLVAMVKVDGRDEDADTELLERLARRQAEYVAEAAG
jgi:hypothetical protein